VVEKFGGGRKLQFSDRIQLEIYDRGDYMGAEIFDFVTKFPLP